MHPSPHHLLLAAVTSLVMACTDGPTDPPPPAPPGPAFELIASPAADGQGGTAGFPLPIPLQVEVRIGGVPAEGIPVTWMSTSGSVGPWSSHTNARGLAYATWRLGSTPGEVQATAAVAGASASPVVFRATAWEQVTAELVAETNIQTGEVDKLLPRDLRVRVTGAAGPGVGIPVLWSTPSGRITDSTLTDGNGIARASWTMPIRPGMVAATALVRGRPGPALMFVANVVPGPVAKVEKVSGDGQSSSLFVNEFVPLRVTALDAFGNTVPSTLIEWLVLQGSVNVFPATTPTGPDGSAITGIIPASPGGYAVVRARHPNGPFVDFSVAVEVPAQARVIYLSTQPAYRFVSGRNGSSPAIDTIAAGESMTWRLVPFDYDNHAIESVGTPAFVGGEFPYASPSEITRIFTTPGTYHYFDPYFEITGTIVVQ